MIHLTCLMKCRHPFTSFVFKCSDSMHSHLAFNYRFKSKAKKEVMNIFKMKYADAKRMYANGDN